MQCNMGAKNHGVIMPDANKEYTINQVSNCPPNISACWRRLRCCRSALHGPVDRSAGGGGQVLVARGENLFIITIIIIIGEGQVLVAGGENLLPSPTSFSWQSARPS